MCHNSRKLSILLVEDSEDDAFFFELALSKSGWSREHTHVIDGGQAIEHLDSAFKKGSPFDVVFLDLKLPVLTGFEVLEWVTAQNYQPPLHVVILSGSDHHADIVRARELGAIDYLVKPVSPEELKKRLSSLFPEAHFETANHSAL